jgi:hypothetical protein
VVPAGLAGLGEQRDDVICFVANLLACDGCTRRGSRPGRRSLPCRWRSAGLIEQITQQLHQLAM